MLHPEAYWSLQLDNALPHKAEQQPLRRSLSSDQLLAAVSSVGVNLDAMADGADAAQPRRRLSSEV